MINVGNTELSHGCEECDAEIKHKCDLNVTKIDINLFDILAIGLDWVIPNYRLYFIL